MCSSDLSAANNGDWDIWAKQKRSILPWNRVVPQDQIGGAGGGQRELKGRWKKLLAGYTPEQQREVGQFAEMIGSSLAGWYSADAAGNEQAKREFAVQLKYAKISMMDVLGIDFTPFGANDRRWVSEGYDPFTQGVEQ